MNLSSLPKIKTRGNRRVGRGISSGRGKTSGRGTKGQNVRGKLPITHPHYEGGQRSLFKRLPIRRGIGNRAISKKPLVVNLKVLNILPKSSQVDLDMLIKSRIVDKADAATYGVKILGAGELSHPLIIKLPTSVSAKAKIEKAGGKVEVSPKPNLNPKISSGSASETLSILRANANKTSSLIKGKGNIKGKTV